MSLTQIFRKIKSHNGPEIIDFDPEGRVEKKLDLKPFFLSLIIILVASLSFGLGRLSGEGGSEPIKIEYSDKISSYTSPTSEPKKLQTASVISAPQISDSNSSLTVYASSKGKKYYYANCSGLKRITDANKISFPTSEAAEASGYSLATNCTPR